MNVISNLFIVILLICGQFEATIQQIESAFDKYKVELINNKKGCFAIRIDNIKTETSSKVIVDNFSFVIDGVNDVLVIDGGNALEIVYDESIGNEHNRTIHSFVSDSLGNVFLGVEYRIRSARNHFVVEYLTPMKRLNIDNYNNYNGFNFSTVNIYSFQGFQAEKTPTIDSYFIKVDSVYKSGSTNEVATLGDINIVRALLKEITVEKRNVQKFNDLAYYFEQNGLFASAILVLNRVIKLSPNRTVAYINLGDAYWGLDDNTKAKVAYAKYVELMKKDNRSHKIPSRVLTRL